MAVRQATIFGPTNEGYIVIEWTGLLNGDVGSAVLMPFYPDKTVQAFGTFGVGGDVDMQGSNVASPITTAPGTADWGQLSDQGGTAISLGSTVGKLIAENHLWVRPHVAAGDGTTALTVRITIAVKGK